VAFHESGHAVVSWFLEYAEPLLKVSGEGCVITEVWRHQAMRRKQGLHLSEVTIFPSAAVMMAHITEQAALRARATGLPSPPALLCPADSGRPVVRYAVHLVPTSHVPFLPASIHRCPSFPAAPQSSGLPSTCPMSPSC
jgi:hypothetical protein